MDKSLKNTKIMGEIGAILPLFSALFARTGGFSLIFSIASIVLILLALSDLAKKSNTNEIFSSYITAFIIQVIGFIAVFFAIIFGGFSLVLGGMIRGGVGRIGFGVIIALILLYLVEIASTYFIKESFDKIGERFDNQNFKTAGALLFYGAIGLIVFGLGAIAMLIGLIFEVIGFFTLPDEIQDQNIPTSSISQP